MPPSTGSSLKITRVGSSVSALSHTQTIRVGGVNSSTSISVQPRQVDPSGGVVLKVNLWPISGLKSQVNSYTAMFSAVEIAFDTRSTGCGKVRSRFRSSFIFWSPVRGVLVIEKVAKTVETVFPEFAVLFGPVMDLAQGRRFGAIEPVFPTRFARYQTGFEQHLQMLRDGGEGNFEMGAEFLYRPRAVQQKVKERPPVGIGDRMENIGSDGCAVYSFK